MKVFVETNRESGTRSRYDEETFVKKEEFPIRYKHPYDYGFIIGTNKDGEDSIDCFIVSDKVHEEGRIIECEPVFMIEMLEGDEVDHKVVMTHGSDGIENPEEVAETIKAFIKKVFTQFPQVTIQFGKTLGKEDTLSFIASRMT